MIRLEKVKTVPEELLDLVKDDTGLFIFWRKVTDSYARTSPELWIAYDEKKPLLVIGAVKLGPFADNAEVWMLPTVHLTWLHLPQLLRLWKEVKTERFEASFKNMRIYARGQGSKTQKFIEWFGGKAFKSEPPDVIYYEVN